MVADMPEMKRDMKVREMERHEKIRRSDHETWSHRSDHESAYETKMTRAVMGKLMEMVDGDVWTRARMTETWFREVKNSR